MPLSMGDSIDTENSSYTIMLEVAGLGHLARTIQAAVPTLDALARVTPQAYAAIGVTAMPDRRKLFDLIGRIPKSRQALESVVFSPDSPPRDEPMQMSPLKAPTPDRKTSFAPSALDELPPLPLPVAQDLSARKSSARNRSMSVSSVPRWSAPAKPPARRSNRILVAIRKRPLMDTEARDGQLDIISVAGETELVLAEHKQRLNLSKYVDTHTFHFDKVFSEKMTNRDVHAATTAPLVDTVFAGGKATCFAYGQTGSGKTHTMLGKGGEIGLYVLAAQDILNRIDTSMSVYASFFEIYAGKLYDLMNDHEQLSCLEGGDGAINIVGLREYPVRDTGGLVQIVNYGNNKRSSGTTGMNADSSRSHAVLHINIYRNGKLLGRMTFVDLAGSERGADTINADRATRMEGAEINKSLLALKECIRALDQGHRHIPFRGTKLTTVLRDSFVGNCRTAMIGNVSPASVSCEHTLNTLRYADRVKELRGGGTRATESMMGRVPTEKVVSGKGSAKVPPHSGRITAAPIGRPTAQPPSATSPLRHAPGIRQQGSPPARSLREAPNPKRYRDYIYRCTAIVERQMKALDALEQDGDLQRHAERMRATVSELAMELERVTRSEN